MEPKGKLILIGGAIRHNYANSYINNEVQEEINLEDTNLFRRILFESQKKTDSRIEIVTTASQIPFLIGPQYESAFKSFGGKNVGVIHIQNRKEAENPVILKRLERSHVVMFTGGDQLRLSSIIGGTRFHDIILDKYQEEEFIYAGTSAGAAAASGHMIYGPNNENILKGSAKVTLGLGLLHDAIVDTHFIERSRMGRLLQLVVSNPKLLGIGLGEDAGLVIKDGKMEAIGSGMTILIDGREIKESNLTQIANGEPLSISKFIVHVMSKYDIYDLHNHQLEIRSFPYTPQFLN
jgi:cyanophycinase